MEDFKNESQQDNNRQDSGQQPFTQEGQPQTSPIQPTVNSQPHGQQNPQYQQYPQQPYGQQNSQYQQYPQQPYGQQNSQYQQYPQQPYGQQNPQYQQYPQQPYGQQNPQNQQYPQQPYGQQYQQYEPQYRQYDVQPPVSPEEQSKASAATTSLVLGIVSLVMVFALCCFGVPILGIIPAIISLVFAVKANKGGKTYSGATAGKVMSIIAIVLSVLLMAFVIYSFISVNGYKNQYTFDSFQDYYDWWQHNG